MNSQIILIQNTLKSKFLFVFLACLIPISLFLRAGVVSVSVIWFFALCLFNFSFPIKDQKFFKSNLILFLPIVLYVLYVAGVFFSDNLETVLDVVARKVHLLFLPLGFIIANKKISSKELHVVLGVFSSVCILFTFVCLFNAAYNVVRFQTLSSSANGHNYFFSYLLTEPIQIPPIYLSLFSNFALLSILNTPYIKKQIYILILTIYLIFFIALCGSVVGIFSMVMIIALSLLAKGHRRILIYLFIIILIDIVAIGFFNPAFLSERLLNLFKFNYVNDSGRLSDYTADRLSIWQSAIEAIKKNPVIGYGSGDGQSALIDSYERSGLIIEKEDSLNAHNEFLSTTLDLGVVGLLFLVTMLVVPLVRAFKSKDTISIGFLLLTLLFFCTESALVRQKGIVFFSFFYSLLLSRLSLRQPKAADSGEMIN